MAAETKISWAKSTLNFWIGCTKVAPECDRCYAERDFDHRHHRVKWGAGNPRSRTMRRTWNQANVWNKRAPGEAFAGYKGFWPVFVNSLSDFFDNEVPPEWRAEAWEVIRRNRNLTFLLLTKRPGNIKKMLPPDWGAGWSNVWLGTTCGTQQSWDTQLAHLCAVPALVHFVSVEPMLEQIDVGNAFDPSSDEFDRPDWLLVGGESAMNPKEARPMHALWPYLLRDAAVADGIAFHFKQWGEWAPLEDPAVKTNLPVALDANGEYPMVLVGREKAGRLLGGQEWLQFPVWAWVWHQLIDIMGADNGGRFYPTRAQTDAAKHPLIELLAHGFFKDDPNELDDSFWQMAAGEQTEAKEYFSRAARAYEELSDVLGEIFDGPPSPQAEPEKIQIGPVDC